MLLLMAIAAGLAGTICPLMWPFTLRDWIVVALLWLLPYSRIAEIALGFLSDANDRVKKIEPKSDLKIEDRLRNLLISYVELIIDFAILYFLLPDRQFRLVSGGEFKERFQNVFQAVYFSAMTITTTGYGDIAPQRWTARLFCMAEPLSGIVLVVLGISAYMTAISQSPSPPKRGS